MCEPAHTILRALRAHTLRRRARRARLQKLLELQKVQGAGLKFVTPGPGHDGILVPAAYLPENATPEHLDLFQHSAPVPPMPWLPDLPVLSIAGDVGVVRTDGLVQRFAGRPMTQTEVGYPNIRVLWYEGADDATFTRAAEIAPLIVELGMHQPSLKSNANLCFTGMPG